MDKYCKGIELYKEGKSIKNICKELHITPRLLRNKLILAGIEIRERSSTSKIIDDDMKQLLIDGYNSHISIRSLSKRYNINRFDISRILQENGITVTQRTVNIDENYFNVIDTEHKAYWLGFLYADGNVSNKNIELTLKYDDIEHIEKFKNDIKSDAIIKDGFRMCKISTNPNKQLHYARFVVTSSKMVSDLIKLGCIPKKSLLLKFPTQDQVPQSLLVHFIRGYFDGDGCISIDTFKTPSLVFQVTGTLDMLNHIKEIFDIKAMPKKYVNIYSLACKGNVKCSYIYNLLYQDATIYLQRKYNIYNNFQFCRHRSKSTRDL